jgi:hypothetical protein
LNNKRTLRQVAVAVMLLVAFLFQGTWALAGTTGGLSGQVTDEKGAAVAGATVKVVSASQASQASTDASGHFNFLSLAPDTYTVGIEKSGYRPVSYAGVTVFADNNQALSFKLEKALTTIATVTSKAAGDLVKGGVGSDIYNVNAAAITSAAPLGGGGNLNSAFSAIASVPGVVVPQGGSGWGQGTFVRGSQSFFTGFEYDGIPVNRAFDNYNASTESSLGLQELQVYTGGGPASNSSAGTSGFINQVFKTGTYPGYGTLTGGIGGPTFYHQAKIEAGGASPDRRFSYYLGLSGYNQEFRYIDNSNGGALTNSPLSIYTGQSTANVSGLGIYGECNTAVEPGSATFDPNPLATTVAPNWYQNNFGAGGTTNCLIPFNGLYGAQSGISDRETVANFHFRIPRKNGTSDDLQLLGSASSLQTSYYTSPNDAGGPAAYTLAVTGGVYCPPGAANDQYGVACGGTNFPHYIDANTYNVPFGTSVQGIGPTVYLQPASNPNRSFGSALPNSLRDTIWNDTGIIKLQYTHQLSGNAFVRAFGYTFFSDWTQAGANSSYNCYVNGNGGPSDCGVAAHYDLITHTAGGELQLVDQINPAHLLELTGNYTTANVVRFNDSGFVAGASPVGMISGNGGTAVCYDSRSTDAAFGSPIGCYASHSKVSSLSPTGAYVAPPATGSIACPTCGAAAAAGAKYVNLWDGNARGSYNTVRPRFGFVSLSDQWRPNDKILINGALRWDNYYYGLVSNPGNAAAFYAAIENNNVCQNASGQLYTSIVKPGSPPPAAVIYVANNKLTGGPYGGTAICPTGYGPVSFNVNSPGSYTITDLSPRLSATYTQSPDTVWRGSIGRFTEPPISASVQYLNIAGDNRTVWNATLPLGFNSPFHPIPAQSATQADLSLERHIRGTDMSFKITPFYNFTVGYQEQSFLGPNFVTQTPVGNFRSTGVEFAFTKGDFSKDGISGQLSLAYTNAKVQATNWFGNNQYVAVNQAITEFNKLTSAGGGSAFYCTSGAQIGAGTQPPGSATSAGCAAGTTAIANPYFGMALQSQMTINGWYPGASTGISPASNPGQGYFDTPWNGTLLLNYRKNKLAITPSFQLSEGGSYGGPLDSFGYDPRVCGGNSDTTANGGNNVVALSPGTNPNQCDWTTVGTNTLSQAAGRLYVPNPATGRFNTPGQYRNPWEFGANLAITYDVSPKVQANLTVANIYHTCFGGTKAAWTTLYPPGKNVCGYGANGLYTSNFYQGTSQFDTAANGIAPQPWQQQPYNPGFGGVSIPVNLYFSVNIKL